MVSYCQVTASLLNCVTFIYSASVQTNQSEHSIRAPDPVLASDWSRSPRDHTAYIFSIMLGGVATLEPLDEVRSQAK